NRLGLGERPRRLRRAPQPPAAGGNPRDNDDCGDKTPGEEAEKAHARSSDLAPPDQPPGGPPKISEALVPPKPNEFDSTYLTRRARASLGTRSMSQEGDGLSRLRVGGTMPSRSARIAKIASTLPAAPSRWPIADLVDDIDSL